VGGGKKRDNMKKSILLLFAVVSVFSLTSCSCHKPEHNEREEPIFRDPNSDLFPKPTHYERMWGRRETIVDKQQFMQKPASYNTHDQTTNIKNSVEEKWNT
jgi:hypothetical protein